MPIVGNVVISHNEDSTYTALRAENFSCTVKHLWFIKCWYSWHLGVYTLCLEPRQWWSHWMQTVQVLSITPQVHHSLIFNKLLVSVYSEAFHYGPTFHDPVLSCTESWPRFKKSRYKGLDTSDRYENDCVHWSLRHMDCVTFVLTYLRIRG